MRGRENPPSFRWEISSRNLSYPRKPPLRENKLSSTNRIKPPMTECLSFFTSPAKYLIQTNNSRAKGKQNMAVKTAPKLCSHGKAFHQSITESITYKVLFT